LAKQHRHLSKTIRLPLFSLWTLYNLISSDLSLEDSGLQEEEEEPEEGNNGLDYDKLAVLEAVASMTKAVLDIHEDQVEAVRSIQGKIIR
jgi:hypothetical protein